MNYPGSGFKPEFQIIDKSEQQRGAFHMKIIRVILNDFCPGEGVNDGNECGFGFVQGTRVG